MTYSHYGEEICVAHEKWGRGPGTGGGGGGGGEGGVVRTRGSAAAFLASVPRLKSDASPLG